MEQGVGESVFSSELVGEREGMRGGGESVIRNLGNIK